MARRKVQIPLGLTNDDDAWLDLPGERITTDALHRVATYIDHLTTIIAVGEQRRNAEDTERINRLSDAEPIRRQRYDT